MKLFVHDQDWQYPAITEKHAFDRIKDFGVNDDSRNARIAYLAFPWATLIDKIKTTGRSSAAHLLSHLENLGKAIADSGMREVITTCQHIRMLEFTDIFEQAGVTHIFWSHCTKGLKQLPSNPDIHVLPFPLYPVQCAEHPQDASKKNVLFSFVGARSNQWYLTSSRQHIIEYLQNDSRGVVIGRDNWHYNKVVYDHQIKQKSSPKDLRGLVDENATDQFKDILQRSIFSLCPSGTGPNSIRLWESLGSGSIPVILADTYLPPGNLQLWEAAAVFCEETAEAIQSLPDRLEKLARDKSTIEQMIHAGRQLWLLYGPDSFTYDIKKLIIEKSGHDIGLLANEAGADILAELASSISKSKHEDSDLCSYFLLSYATRILISSPTVRKEILNSRNLLSATEKALGCASNKSKLQFLRVREMANRQAKVEHE